MRIPFRDVERRLSGVFSGLGVSEVCAVVCGDNVRWGVFAWSEPVRAVCDDGAERECGSDSRAEGGCAIWSAGAVGWATGTGNLKPGSRNGAGNCLESRAWDWLRGDGEHESLDAGRNVWMAGHGFGS